VSSPKTGGGEGNKNSQSEAEKGNDRERKGRFHDGKKYGKGAISVWRTQRRPRNRGVQMTAGKTVEKTREEVLEEKKNYGSVALERGLAIFDEGSNIVPSN